MTNENTMIQFVLNGAARLPCYAISKAKAKLIARTSPVTAGPLALASPVKVAGAAFVIVDSEELP